MMVDMMRGVIRSGENYHGTGVRLRNQFNIQQDIAGKTGTTQNSADNWFVAMMPHIVMGSWVGGEDRRIRFPTNSPGSIGQRSEEHTSELQSRGHLVCRLLLEKKKKKSE